MKLIKISIVLYISILINVFFNGARAQNVPIYGWQSYFSYYAANYVTQKGNTLIVPSEIGMFTYDLETGAYEKYSKVNGMNDIQPLLAVYDPKSDYTVITYANSNIDVWDGNTFSSIPYVKNASVSGDKNIYDIFIHNGNAYLSTGQGVVVINVAKKEIKETYNLSTSSIPQIIKSVYILKDTIYAATSTGLYKAPLNGPALQILSNWTLIKVIDNLNSLSSLNNNLYASTDKRCYKLTADTLKSIYLSDSSAIKRISTANGTLYISEFFLNKSYTYFAKTITFDSTDQNVGTINGGNPVNAIGLLNGDVYMADRWEGLRLLKDNNSVKSRYAPNGPNISAGFNVWANNGEVWIAHGGYNVEKMESYFRRNGVSVLKDGTWKQFTNSYFGTSDACDLSQIQKDPNNNNMVFSSFIDGIYTLTPDYKPQIINDTSKVGVCILNGYPTIKTAGIAYDESGNMWATCFGAQYELVCKTPDNVWYRYNVPINRTKYTYNAGKLIIDDYQQKWYAAPYNSGIIVYNDNRTIENASDDRYIQLSKGQGFGNLPGANVYCLAKDKDGAIWVGTENGIGIFNCASEVVSGQCQAELRIVQYDQFANYLFAEKAVRAIAVDGANRKWVGTAEGVWLLSADADKILARFTADNSPLPSNNIVDINIDPITGLVFFSTEAGVVSYRSDATEGKDNDDQFLVFPNPVKSGYNGSITISGLVSNSSVSITDVSGQLIYKGSSNGGTFVWNGLDYTGRRPQSGVYLVFVTTKDGLKKHVGKLAFME